MKILISAGPTREPIDDIRFITNKSTGKMGIAMTEEALHRGYETTLILGPTQEQPPNDAKLVRVETAARMKAEVVKALAGKYDVFISTAAVADYTPEKRGGKIKSGDEMRMKLTPTEKIVDEAKKRFPETFVVGFKTEYGVSEKSLIESAKQKMNDAGLDLIVANDVSKNVFGSGENQVHIIEKNGEVKSTGRKTKREIAGIVFDVISNSGSAGV